jgi:erythromycin esterase
MSPLLVSRPGTARQLPPVSSPQFAKESTGLKWGLRAARPYVLAATVCLVGVLPDVGRAQQTSDAFERWASARAIPLRTLEADGDAMDLVPLKSVVGASRVVALGEPTHGTHEPLAFRNRLMRFLVEQMGFTAIALETGFTESHSIEQFVAGGPGQLRGVVRDGMSWGFGQYPENEELIQWIRDYNGSTTHHRKVRLYGIDLSGGNNGALLNSRRAVDFAVAFLARADSVEARRIRQGLDPLLERFSDAKYSELLPTERERLASGLTEVAAALERKRSSLVRISSDEEYQWALHNVAVGKQLNLAFEVSPPPSAPGRGISPELYRLMNVRDSAMADNVRWALEHEGPNGRLVVFAHNDHVMNAVLEGGIWASFRQPSSAMGKFLRAVLGRDLVIIGTAARATAGGLPQMEADSTSLDAALSAVAIPRFIIDIRPARDEQLVFAWLSERRSLYANLETHLTITPSTAFDALFFVDTLTPARARQP